MSKSGKAAASAADDDHVDGCDMEFHEGDATPDAELPTAAGGVAAVHNAGADEDGADGCDVDFNAVEATKDEELPVAAGGVA